MTLDAVGGVWRYAVDLAAALEPLGVEVVLAGLGPEPSADRIGEAEAHARLEWLKSPLDWLADSENDLASVGRNIAALASQCGADLIHLNGPSQAAGLRTDLPVLAVSHSCLATWWETNRKAPLPPEWRWRYQREAAGLARADRVVTPSRSHAEAVRAAYRDVGDVEVVHNACRPLPRGDGAGDYVAAAARWWDEGKGGGTLDRAASIMSYPVIAAGATQGPNGQGIAFGHARAAGEQSHAEVLRLMRSACAFVSPSVYEPFGLAALEAASAGIPLILSDIATYRELWADAALFFDPGDARQLARLVEAVRADPDLRRDLSERAAARARRFTPAAQAVAMHDLYAGLLAGTVSAKRSIGA